MAIPKIIKDVQEVRDENITAISAVLESGAIHLELPTTVMTGSVVKFVAPCTSDRVTNGIVIDGVVYEIVDAMNSALHGKDGYWDTDVIVSVLIDVERGKAYIQNSAEAKHLLDIHDASSVAHPELTSSISDLEVRIAKLDTFLMSDVTSNPHIMTLDNIDGLVVTGVWNEAQSRLEC